MSLARSIDVDGVLPARSTLAWGALIVNAEALALLAYLVARGESVTVIRPLLLVVPFVWINVALWAVVRTQPVSASRRNRLLAAAVAVGYFLILAVVGGLVGPPQGLATGLDVSVASLPPGWGPSIFYDGALVEVVILPYKVAGYAALAYLVYATALEASNALVGGVLGLFSCVSCTFPVIAALVTGVAGSGTAIAAAVYTHSYLLSTVVFVVTVGLLYWRPDPRRLRG